MYRIGSTKFAFAALLPINTLFLARSGKTLAALRLIMVTFQGLMTLWLVAMAVFAVMALSLRKKQDLRAPRVADPRIAIAAAPSTSNDATVQEAAVHEAMAC